MSNAELVALVRDELLAVSLYPLPALSMDRLNVAAPPVALTGPPPVSTAPVVPVPLMIATVMLAVLVVTVLP